MPDGMQVLWQIGHHRGMAVRRRLVVRGRVQGVFFRDSVRAEAKANGVRGWVRNRDDGSVEAVFEGEPGAVERVSAFCRAGPPRARVDRVDERDEEPEGLDGFSVR
ncbi:MAG TPA: acylphosphatase [Solirubrobacteraceae bacterium]|nr:acylphosphatase [Solirubrobacteraceae bacterium]